MKCGFFAALLCISIAHADTDPLLSKMEGKWHGHGIRTYAISERQITVDADVETSDIQVGGQLALLSQNRITESAPNTPSRTYMTIYWVRPAQGRPGSYELGAQNSIQPSSSGSLDSDGIFRVEQDLGGGNPPFMVKSETQFLPEHTIYSDTFSNGTAVQSQTRIDYQRTTP